jgi:rubredoxin
MKKHVCGPCFYVYEPEMTDVDGNPMAFEDLPEDWVCPVCGAGKEAFEEQESSI